MFECYNLKCPKCNNDLDLLISLNKSPILTLICLKCNKPYSKGKTEKECAEKFKEVINNDGTVL